MGGAKVAHPLEGAFLQYPQKLDLHGRAQFGNLVEKDRAAVRQLKTPFLVPDRSGEGTFDVAEKLAFEQTFGQGRAVDRNEQGTLAVTLVVNGLGHELLADAAFALNQNRKVAGRKLDDFGKKFAHGQLTTDDVLKLIRGQRMAAQDSQLRNIAEKGETALVVAVIIDKGVDFQGDRYLAAVFVMDEGLRVQFRRIALVGGNVLRRVLPFGQTGRPGDVRSARGGQSRISRRAGG